MSPDATAPIDGHTLSLATRDTLAALEGLIPEAVGLRLASLASSVPADRCIVEIGSYKGKSTCYLAAGARAGLGAPVFAIDPWELPGNITGRFHFADRETREAFTAQVARAGLTAQVTPFRAFADLLAPFWLRPIGLLYIDGSHAEGDVWNDWSLWSPHLAPGGIVAFDDYRTPRNPGVAAIVDRLRYERTGMRWEEGPAPLVVGWMR